MKEILTFSIKLVPKFQVMKIFADTYYSQEVMAQSVDASYDDAFDFGIAFWNDAAEEIHLSLVAVDKNGLILYYSFLNCKNCKITCHLKRLLSSR